MEKDEVKPKASVSRVRIGILIWVFSYLPLPYLLLLILHNAGYLKGKDASATFLLIMYAIQFVIGFIGLIIAGKESITLVKSYGIKKLPKTLWRVIVHGKIA